jgi:uncharacterized membrane protein
VSNQGNQNTVPVLTITGNPLIDGLILKGLVALGFIAATWIAATLKLADPNLIPWIAGIIASILTALAAAGWGWIQSKRNRAAFIQAGANLVVSEQAVDTAGNIIRVIMPNSVSLKPVTVEAGAEIAKKHAPTVLPKTV